MNTLILLAPFLVAGADQVPADDDVKAGWVAFWIFIGLAVAVALLGFSLAKHLRKARTTPSSASSTRSDQPRRNAS